MVLNHLYGGMDEPELAMIDVFVAKLRRKLALVSGGRSYIRDVDDRGFRLADPA
jgi:two-component system, cell cycle response regulator CtrA